jgi:hypothetical protein
MRVPADSGQTATVQQLLCLSAVVPATGMARAAGCLARRATPGTRARPPAGPRAAPRLRSRPGRRARALTRRPARCCTPARPLQHGSCFQLAPSRLTYFATSFCHAFSAGCILSP